jgi:hypothetical protein
MTATSVLSAQPVRELYIDRRVVTVKPDRIDIHPARSIIFLPLFVLALEWPSFRHVLWGDSLGSMRVALTLLPLYRARPRLGLCTARRGTPGHRAPEATAPSRASWAWGGTQELIPFWKVDKIVVKELTPHDYRGHQRTSLS